jgi:hypothetical protein
VYHYINSPDTRSRKFFDWGKGRIRNSKALPFHGLDAYRIISQLPSFYPYEEQARQKAIKNLKRKAHQLGFQLIEEAAS